MRVALLAWELTACLHPSGRIVPATHAIQQFSKSISFQNVNVSGMRLMTNGGSYERCSSKASSECTQYQGLMLCF